jgi:hypothetical protein
MTSLAMQKMFYTKHLLGKSTTTLNLFMLMRKCSVVKSCILAQYYHIAATGTQRKVIISVWAFTAVFCLFVTLVRSSIKAKH